MWYEKSKFTCPKGCGMCCSIFEPDIYESESLYMASWLIHNKMETAIDVANGKFPFSREKYCQFWDENNPYHCSVYNCRPAICRLFGGCGTYSKSKQLVWRPCKFYPAENLEKHIPPLSHRPYSADETKKIFGYLPPAMNELMEQIVLLNEENMQTKLIRDIFPQIIKKLLFIINLNKK